MFFIFLIIRQEVPQSYTTNLLSWSESLGINFLKKWVMKNYINFTKVCCKVYIFDTVLQHGTQFSTSLSQSSFKENPRIIVPHRDVFWYCLIGMVDQKKFSNFFTFMFYEKTKWSRLQIFQKQKYFPETQMCFPDGMAYWIFSDPWPPPLCDF